MSSTASEPADALTVNAGLLGNRRRLVPAVRIEVIDPDGGVIGLRVNRDSSKVRNVDRRVMTKLLAVLAGVLGVVLFFWRRSEESWSSMWGSAWDLTSSWSKTVVHEANVAVDRIATAAEGAAGAVAVLADELGGGASHAAYVAGKAVDRAAAAADDATDRASEFADGAKERATG
jgi:hypothetical protein